MITNDNALEYIARFIKHGLLATTGAGAVAVHGDQMLVMETSPTYATVAGFAAAYDSQIPALEALELADYASEYTAWVQAAVLVGHPVYTHLPGTWGLTDVEAREVWAMFNAPFADIDNGGLAPNATLPNGDPVVAGTLGDIDNKNRRKEIMYWFNIGVVLDENHLSDDELIDSIIASRPLLKFIGKQ